MTSPASRSSFFFGQNLVVTTESNDESRQSPALSDGMYRFVAVVVVVVRESDALALLHATEECFPRERDGFPRP